MNNFEKRLFVDYFSKLINDIDLKHYNFDDLMDFFFDEFKVNRNRIERDQNGSFIFGNIGGREKFRTDMKKILKELQEKLPVKKTSLEKQLLSLKEIFKLSEEEYGILLYFIMKEYNGIFRELFDCVSGHDTFGRFCKCVIKLRYNRRGRLMESLYLKRLTDSRRGGDADINPEILGIFDDETCSTPDKIIAVLLGKREKSNLTLSDYDHIKKERDKAINILKSAVEQKKKGVNILLYGYVGTGKTQFAKLIANSAKIPMYAVKTEKEDYEEANRSFRLADLYSKQEMLSRAGRACILFDEAEDVMNRGFSAFGSASKGYLNKILEETPIPVIWTTNNISDVDPAFLRRMSYAIEFEKLSDETRLNIWNRVLKKNKFKVKKSKIEELNKTYDVSPSIISNAVQMTKLTSGTEEDFEGYIENITRVVMKRKNIKSPKSFNAKEYDLNLVNSDLSVENLTEKIKACGKLNFSICMYGEPGTGKSEYSRYLADCLGIKAIQKRVSDLVSPFVGQTEQNIAAAFQEAKNKKAMLIFDEADSFLQSRANAGHSWEISQVNEMLTWMESHEYPFVCTTNLLDTLDEASLRRFTFKIKFDFMNPEQINLAMKHFFNIEDADLNIKGLTTGDFATVKKKADFLEIRDTSEIEKMLRDEVRLKQSKTLKNTVGF
ncbi:ATP-binding protein [bacterium]|nr:ATP-binding protein [bacterium]